MLCRGIWQTPTQKQTFRTTSYKTKAVANLILRQPLFITISPTFLRSSFAHHSLIVRSLFAYRSVKVRANGQINLGVNSLCILLVFSLGLVRVGFRLDLKGCPQGR